ncbi:MAG: hypothetical protein AAF235_04610, partial [Planctomycetota bacterium]
MQPQQQRTPTKRAQTVEKIRRHLFKKETDAAAQAIKALPTKLRADPEIRFLEALTLEKQGRNREAMVLAEKSVEVFDHPEPWLLLARCYRIGGFTEKCLDACSRV